MSDLNLKYCSSCEVHQTQIMISNHDIQKYRVERFFQLDVR